MKKIQRGNQTTQLYKSVNRRKTPYLKKGIIPNSGYKDRTHNTQTGKQSYRYIHI